MVSCKFIQKGLGITVNGGLRPCVQSKLNLGTIDNLEDTSLRKEAEQLFKGGIPAQCYECENKELRGLPSRRTSHYGMFSDDNDYYIEFLDINVGNLCNLKCRMCNPACSSKWLKDRQALLDSGLNKLSSFSSQKVQDNITDKVLLFINKQTKLRYVILKGGEPFMHPRFYELLDAIPQPEKVTLQIITNGTHVLTERDRQILRRFKHLNFFFSIEADGSMYSYIRGGDTADFDRVYQNFNEYSKFDNIHEHKWLFTANIYGVFSFDSLQSSIHHWVDFGQMVRDPAFLNPLILPDYIKNELIDETPYEHFKEYLRVDAESLYGFTEERKAELLDQFRLYTITLDKQRKENLFDVEPRFKRLFYN